MREGYGITGLPEDAGSTGGLNTQTIGGYTQMGRQNSNPQHQDPFVFNPRINYTRILGNHALKAGYEFQMINTEIEDFHPKYGEDQYSGQFSRPAGAASANIYNLADFFFGARSTYNLNNVALLNYRQRMHFAYVQDDWKVEPQADPQPRACATSSRRPQYEKDNHLANFDPATNTLIQARDGSLFDRSGVHPDRNNFAPRVGAAYQLTPQDRDPRRVRDQLRPLQPAGRREHARLQRALHRGGQRGPAGLPAPLHGQRVPQLLPPHPGRLSGGPHDLRELQPARRARELHAGGHAHRLRAELAPDRAARAALEPAARRRLRRQPQRQAHRPRRLQPGAPEQRPAIPPRARPCRRGGPSRASPSSRPRSRAGTPTTIRCR